MTNPSARRAYDGAMDRFDRFTDRVRKVLTLAQDEAQRFNHNYIGTEHILLGLIREGEGVGARVLVGLGVELAKARTAVEFIIGRGDRRVTGEVGLTPGGKRVIEFAIDEARRLGHNYIGTEHLLLGLVREGEGIAAGVLESLGVNLDNVRREVIRTLSESSGARSGSGARVGMARRDFTLTHPAVVEDLETGKLAVGTSEPGYTVRARLTRATRSDEDAQVAFYKVVGTQRHFVWGFPIESGSYAVDARSISRWVVDGGAGRYVARVVGDDDEVLAEGEFRIEPTALGQDDQ